MITSSYLAKSKRLSKAERADLAKVTGKVLKEDIDPSSYKKSDLTTDCYFVHLSDGRIDLAKGGMVPIFDDYHDRKLTISRMELAGGSRNPKLSTPEV